MRSSWLTSDLRSHCYLTITIKLDWTAHTCGKEPVRIESKALLQKVKSHLRSHRISCNQMKQLPQIWLNKVTDFIAIRQNHCTSHISGHQVVNLLLSDWLSDPFKSIGTRWLLLGAIRDRTPGWLCGCQMIWPESCLKSPVNWDKVVAPRCYQRWNHWLYLNQR